MGRPLDESSVKKLIEDELGDVSRLRRELHSKGFSGSFDTLKLLFKYIQSLEDRIDELENRIDER
ncbi:MAG TPA: hypothetical protein VGG44_05550 [Tepidisphaeraceae bacterium]